MPHQATATGKRSVVIVAASAETLDELCRYLEDAGLAAGGTRELKSGVLAAATAALVVFPDDFEEDAVLAFLRGVRVARPDVALVAVTRHPQRFQGVTTRDGRPVEMAVLPRPSFGWAILDALAPHAP
jgi:hypothetical protein